eukprot:TRINITY_DN1218_c0_g1_i2.p1 TRINITY_DN1218_c0_g1~~TRINITY_DN1218_c0_g1_i2.p1  ORF type:complete len:238 (-),score=72.58 TRINITY_DN1218_c0_g1_i2:81-794(-)
MELEVERAYKKGKEKEEENEETVKEEEEKKEKISSTVLALLKQDPLNNEGLEEYQQQLYKKPQDIKKEEVLFLTQTLLQRMVMRQPLKSDRKRKYDLLVNRSSRSSRGPSEELETQTRRYQMDYWKQEERDLQDFRDLFRLFANLELFWESRPQEMEAVLYEMVSFWSQRAVSLWFCEEELEARRAICARFIGISIDLLTPLSDELRWKFADELDEVRLQAPSTTPSRLARIMNDFP